MAEDIERQIRGLLAAGELKQVGTLCIRAYGGAILWFLTRKLNHTEMAKEAFADFASDLWSRLLKAPPPPELRFLAWMYKIAHNAHRRRIRSLLRKYRFTSRDQEDIVQDSLDRFSKQIERATEHAELARLRSLLDDDERALLALVYDEELTSAEVAVVLEISPEAVRTRVHRVKAKLKRYAAA